MLREIRVVDGDLGTYLYENGLPLPPSEAARLANAVVMTAVSKKERIERVLSEGQAQLFVEPKRKRRRAEFVPPTPEMVDEYAKANGYLVDGGTFCAYYGANDWRFKNGRKMTNWKQSVISWSSREKGTRDAIAKPSARAQKYAE